MKFSMALSMLLASGFIQTAVGLKCSSGCAACWQDNNSNGADIKIRCGGNMGENECGNNCPTGYSGLHCANASRCVCEDGNNCSELGPCQCGVQHFDGNGRTVGYQACGSVNADGTCS
ncbi:hypothetical protein K443DRAFT_674614 [Laccaria amethystina LaAM-08-1]|uniref:EGF-like domain-containing protein n=1 Tax=Laccaria amethystina LaAM-08-1 TaxID=1095629 RepID=A0A0C9XWT8_9AGAR|nr:hypothetical protein K443DRAFT_674614 [Laccaria amethystina LaAM-08-1]